MLSGYVGGKKMNPSYKEVCGDGTGHAEAIDITFFPDVISYREILEVFFTIHDPTTLNRQGNDIGTQYRSAICYHHDEQKNIAQQIIREMDQSGIWDAPIVTEVKPYKKFYSAEEYHRDYFERNPGQAYCQAVIAPKVAEFRKRWENKLKG